MSSEALARDAVMLMTICKRCATAPNYDLWLSKGMIWFYFLEINALLMYPMGKVLQGVLLVCWRITYQWPGFT